VWTASHMHSSLHDLYLHGKTKQKNVDTKSPSRILVSDPNVWMIQNTLLAQCCSATENDLDLPHEIGMMTNFEHVHNFCMNSFFIAFLCFSDWESSPGKVAGCWIWMCFHSPWVLYSVSETSGQGANLGC